MNDQIAYRPLEALTMAELGVLKQVATRYSEIMREHAYLVGLINLAMRTEDMNLLATAKRRLAETELECKKCSSAMQDLGQDLLRAGTNGIVGELAEVSQACEYATA